MLKHTNNYQQFWEALKDKIMRSDIPLNINKTPDQSWIFIDNNLNIRGFGYIISIYKFQPRVSISFDNQREINEYYFDQLAKEQDLIEREIGKKLKWERTDSYKPSRKRCHIYIEEQTNTTINERIEFIIRNLRIFNDVFQKRLEKIKNTRYAQTFAENNLNKFIFNSEKPKDFLAYELLLKLIKDRDNELFIDPYFFSELFKNEIFDTQTVKEIWDKPTDFAQLSGQEKAKVYIENYSHKDYKNVVKEKITSINNNKFCELFDTYLASPDVYENETNKIPVSTLEFERIKQFDSDFIDDLFFDDLFNDNFEQIDFDNDKNYIFFITVNEQDEKQSYDRLLDFTDNIERVSLLITTVNDYNKLLKIAQKQGINFQLPKEIKPILLNSLTDIQKLIDFLYRDIYLQEKKRAKQEEISYLNRLEIKKYFCIKNIKLNSLKKHKEIYFLGENGDGKTILLQSIVLALKGNNNIGQISDFIKSNPYEDFTLTAWDNYDVRYNFTKIPSRQKNSFKNIFAYGINRFCKHQGEKDNEGYLTLFGADQYLENPVEWLQNLDYKEKSNDYAHIGLQTAKELLIDLLDKNIEIDVNPDNVIFTERGTKLQFQQLSDGYKSVIIWVIDLLSRLSENQPYADKLSDFKGIVLIDEIGALLHPKWEYTIVRKIRDKFPNLQFILTTHSPILVMGASDDAKFFKVYKKAGVSEIEEDPVQKISHLMANGLITSPLFRLPTARTASYDEKNEKLDLADDFIYGKIHQIVSQEIQTQNNINEDQIINLIKQELENI